MQCDQFIQVCQGILVLTLKVLHTRKSQPWEMSGLWPYNYQFLTTISYHLILVRCHCSKVYKEQMLERV